MRREVLLAICVGLGTACGDSGAGRGKHVGSAEDGLAACSYFESGIVSRVFAIEPERITYKRSLPLKRAGHVLCSAYWEKPDKAEMEARYQAEIQEWAKSIGSADRKAQPRFPNIGNEISITLLNQQYDSAEDAVASLDSAVATLSKGIAVTAGGQQRTVQTEFADWVDGVGDKAIFTDKGALLIAHDGRRMTLSVRVADDPAANRQLSVEFAQAFFNDG